MDKLARPLRQKWLMLILVGGGLAIALPGHSGSVPTGLTSGVSVGGSNLLPIGASTLCIYQEVDQEAAQEVEPVVCQEERLESASANATVDPVTGDITLTVAAQQALNTSANQIAQGLRGTNPVLAILLTTPREISLTSPSPVGASGPSEDQDAYETVADLAAAAAAAIANGESVSLTSSQMTLGIAAPTVAQASGSNPILVTSAVFTAQGGTPMVAPLRGTMSQISNTTGFLAAAFATGLTPNQVAPFTEMALVGGNYRDLVLLFNAVSGLIPPQPQPRSTALAIDPTQLEEAIQAYNRIVDNSAPETLVTLSENSDFVALGRSLQQLRAAIEAVS
ncbi:MULTISPECIES: hypothetical protein [Cyanophyceae]|uniref:hypothetical protein n=1 Tax=Cyanophyceae TaxID=3028117 RepID=UPI001684CDAE|nr:MULTISPECIES: hypothetical protein [Cyanophyceae]MBD1917284.1 hypothetical protein [Phormidium sp. FACHB-77]MBD2032207.1 hypothetical protein [Phormidium sp. FACHB-322]MBD2053245.1 hypothetical protein [Leptolyngbya sp. FACHB-60]